MSRSSVHVSPAAVSSAQAYRASHPLPPDAELPFGKIPGDLMLRVDHDEEHGWHKAHIIRHGNVTLPAWSPSFHYGIGCFEGGKGFWQLAGSDEGRVGIWLLDFMLQRLMNSIRRLGVPAPKSMKLPREGIIELVRLQQSLVPHTVGTALYLRPFVVAHPSEAYLGVAPPHKIRLYVTVSPSGSYYGGGALKGTRIYVDPDFERVPELGAMGAAKIGGNYVTMMPVYNRAKRLGFDQVLCTRVIYDHNRDPIILIDEIGTSNAHLVIDGKVWTPTLADGTVLPGGTRWVVENACSDLGVPWEGNQRIAIGKLERADEFFATGTAAVISPTFYVQTQAGQILFNQPQIGPITQRLYDHIVQRQHGYIEDNRGYLTIV